jgi:hypothetical protein
MLGMRPPNLTLLSDENACEYESVIEKKLVIA